MFTIERTGNRENRKGHERRNEREDKKEEY